VIADSKKEKKRSGNLCFFLVLVCCVFYLPLAIFLAMLLLGGWVVNAFETTGKKNQKKTW